MVGCISGKEDGIGQGEGGGFNRIVGDLTILGSFVCPSLPRLGSRSSKLDPRNLLAVSICPFLSSAFCRS